MQSVAERPIEGVDADLQGAYAQLRKQYHHPNWPHENCGTESITRLHDHLLGLQQAMRQEAQITCLGRSDALVNVFRKLKDVFMATPGLETNNVPRISLHELLEKLPAEFRTVVQQEWPQFLQNPLTHRCFEMGKHVELPCALIVPVNFRTHDSDFGAKICNTLGQEPYFVFRVRVHDDLGLMPEAEERFLEPGRRFATLDEAACIFAAHPTLRIARGLAQKKGQSGPYAGQVYFAGDNWELYRDNAVWNRPVQGELLGDSTKYEARNGGKLTVFPRFHHMVTVQDFSAAGGGKKPLPMLEDVR